MSGNPVASSIIGTPALNTPQPMPMPTPTPVLSQAPAAGSVQALDVSCPRIIVHSISTSDWPSTLILNLPANNWYKWDFQLNSMLALSGGMHKYPMGTKVTPDVIDEPCAERNWRKNDYAILQLTHHKVSQIECDLIMNFTSSQCAYEFLHDHHQKQGIFMQIILLQELFSI